MGFERRSDEDEAGDGINFLLKKGPMSREYEIIAIILKALVFTWILEEDCGVDELNRVLQKVMDRVLRRLPLIYLCFLQNRIWNLLLHVESIRIVRELEEPNAQMPRLILMTGEEDPWPLIFKLRQPSLVEVSSMVNRVDDSSKKAEIMLIQASEFLVWYAISKLLNIILIQLLTYDSFTGSAERLWHEYLWLMIPIDLEISEFRLGIWGKLRHDLLADGEFVIMRIDVILMSWCTPWTGTMFEANWQFTQKIKDDLRWVPPGHCAWFADFFAIGEDWICVVDLQRQEAGGIFILWMNCIASCDWFSSAVFCAVLKVFRNFQYAFTSLVKRECYLAAVIGAAPAIKGLGSFEQVLGLPPPLATFLVRAAQGTSRCSGDMLCEILSSPPKPLSLDFVNILVLLIFLLFWLFCFHEDWSL